MDETGTIMIRYLRSLHESMRWKLEGLSEYDLRRPLTPTGSNLLGIVKHVASVELEYMTNCVDRPCPVDLPWFSQEAELNEDLYLKADETSVSIIALLDLAESETVKTLTELSFEAPAHGPWWAGKPEMTVGWLAVHLLAEIARHAGHMDILREQLDGEVGLRKESPDMRGISGEEQWAEYRAKVEAAAREAGKQ